jgi:hypothetical protein
LCWREKNRGFKMHRRSTLLRRFQLTHGEDVAKYRDDFYRGEWQNCVAFVPSI